MQRPHTHLVAKRAAAEGGEVVEDTCSELLLGYA